MYFTAQSLPLQFHVYTLMPLVLWSMCITKILQTFDLSRTTQMVLHVKGLELFEILFYLISIELLVIYKFKIKMFDNNIINGFITDRCGHFLNVAY